MTDDEILELKMNSDIGETTIRRWLRELLLRLWRDGEGFNGKRPFGNSGWQFDVYKPLIKAGLIKGTLDEDGCIDEVDWIEGDSIVNRLIVRMCEPHVDCRRAPETRYVRFSNNKIARTIVSQLGDVSIDFSEDGVVVGVEIL